jgi:hypothetical protein
VSAAEVLAANTADASSASAQDRSITPSDGTPGIFLPK